MSEAIAYAEGSRAGGVSSRGKRVNKKNIWSLLVAVLVAMGSFTEKDSGILESYLTKIRRDGVAKHADMKQKLDMLAENNTAIVTLIKTYASHAKTPAFTVEGDKFRNYVSAWRDRWNSLMELFMAGGNYAASGFVFPKEFASAVDAEIVAAK